MYNYNCKVLRVIDGDTLLAAVDLGCDIAVNLTIRLNGINCPEMRGDSLVEGRLAKNFTYNWVLDQCREGQPLILRTLKDKREKYGRYLGEVFTQDGTSLNEALVLAGHATRADYRP
jgi:micrococcal nuclease